MNSKTADLLLFPVVSFELKFLLVIFVVVLKIIIKNYAAGGHKNALDHVLGF